jgi:hypothetical protein
MYVSPRIKHRKPANQTCICTHENMNMTCKSLQYVPQTATRCSTAQDVHFIIDYSCILNALVSLSTGRMGMPHLAMHAWCVFIQDRCIKVFCIWVGRERETAEPISRSNKGVWKYIQTPMNGKLARLCFFPGLLKRKQLYVHEDRHIKNIPGSTFEAYSAPNTTQYIYTFLLTKTSFKWTHTYMLDKQSSNPCDQAW